MDFITAFARRCATHLRGVRGHPLHFRAKRLWLPTRIGSKVRWLSVWELRTDSEGRRFARSISHTGAVTRVHRVRSLFFREDRATRPYI